ncbi:hypothetical protein D3C76_1817360 [compost metagenome]
MRLRAAVTRAGGPNGLQGRYKSEVVGIQTVTDRKDLICLYWGVFSASTAD